MKNIRIFILGFGIIFMIFLVAAATLKTTERYRLKNTAKEMLGLLNEQNHFIAAAELAKQDQGSKRFEIVDVRDPKSYITFHMDGAINIPFDRILEKENLKFFGSETEKLLYCDDGWQSNAAWMILTQYGYHKMVVLDGGLETWKKYISMKNPADTLRMGDEIPAFDFAGLMNKDTVSAK